MKLSGVCKNHEPKHQIFIKLLKVSVTALGQNLIWVVFWNLYIILIAWLRLESKPNRGNAAWMHCREQYDPINYQMSADVGSLAQLYFSKQENESKYRVSIWQKSWVFGKIQQKLEGRLMMIISHHWTLIGSLIDHNSSENLRFQGKERFRIILVSIAKQFTTLYILDLPVSLISALACLHTRQPVWPGWCNPTDWTAEAISILLTAFLL